MAGLALRPNACPAKRPSLRACGAGVGFGGLIYQHIQTAICGYFERPTLRGCIFAANYGRVGASLQHLPCQKTKPKGLWCGSELWWFGFICVFTRLYVDGFERPTLRGCILRRTMAGLALRPNACPAKRPSLRACWESFAGCRLSL
ncbi:hypothetical protein GCWU000325_00729 [Alloprevotella tannerae ATCC 51259]|uniref:Uncharacterized protein n=1 Tax=Alloprevotella tannerae ATCC 51259 TaxID=626522 RepID=C9LEU8_9BACT|nr:hypothetical protein GCWU000325_00729 [Alloprevotella tannerae ATCC 51259]